MSWEYRHGNFEASLHGDEAKLADMLLDPVAVPAKVKSHVAQCEGCSQELAELAATMSLLDTWRPPSQARIS